MCHCVRILLTAAAVGILAGCGKAGLVERNGIRNSRDVQFVVCHWEMYRHLG